MMLRTTGILICLAWLAIGLGAQPEPSAVEHVAVFKEAGRFGGWPANHGIWSWGDEIVVGFEAGYFQSREQGHAIDYSRPALHHLARSLDGGRTWSIETPEGLRPPAGLKVAGVPTAEGGPDAVDCPGGIDFAHPDFALTARMASIHIGPSRFYYSMDRGKTWQGPCKLPDFGQPGVAARTDYIVNGPGDCMLLLTVAKSNGREGRVVTVRTTDGGKSWNLVSFVGPEPPVSDYSIMPATVRLSPERLLTTVRHRGFIDAYRSDDNGNSWYYLNRPAPNTGRGNPSSLTRLRDGRVAIVYGFRAEPFGMRARLSADEGSTWSEEIILRQDGGNWDLGYPRTVQRQDGKLVTIYYYNEAKDSERYIGATIWDPGPR